MFMKSLIILVSLALSISQKIDVFESKIREIPCQTCHALVKGLQTGERIIDSEIQILLEQVAMAVCVGKKMFIRSVCKGAINEMVPAILDSIVTRYLSADEICPLIRMCPKVYEILDTQEYINEVLSDKPIDIEWPQVNPNGKKIKMIHMSDLHFDLMYKEGSKTVCDKPVCCREDSGEVGDDDEVSGYWGSLASCNIPQRTMEQMFQFMRNEIYNEEDRFILLWTGDNTSHDIWQQSTQKNLQSTEIATALLKKYFEGAKNIEIIPQTGNHEAFPVNVFDYKSEREVGFRKDIADQWRDWIGNDAADMLQKKGFYKYEPEGLNLKILSYDTQVCNIENWYLIKDPTDPSGFLEWARQELYQSEAIGQVVYLSAHMYSKSCLRQWSRRFEALIDRFSHIIRAQIHGHSHGEWFYLYRGLSDKQPLNVAFISSSVTTYTFKNPSFRYFEIDQETLIPLNYFQYRLDLDKANKEKHQILNWKNVFNFLEEYGVKSMRPRDIQEMLERVLVDKQLAIQLEYNQNSGYYAPDDINQKGKYCELSTSNSDDEQVCNGGSITLGTEEKIIEFLQGKWRRRINK